ncbi:MAG: enterochelin esterase [Proteobacteria bacterium]|nr:enterochelin esterase [Pseudomonadota bacterium]MBI3498970.1 enterochelin esterase [Pseudomonadota bacterium]
MRRERAHPPGEVRRLTLASRVLEGNLLGDPTTRPLEVYLPPGFRAGERLPLLVDLVGFTGSGLAHTNWRPFTENAPERLDRLIGSGAMAPAVVAFPDCFTRLGGNQYINSAAMGRYEDYLVQEAVPLVEREFGCGGAGNRGCFGKSSGGFGAITHAMRRADFWAAAACHSGDMAFDLVYLADMPNTLNELAKHRRSIETFIKHFEAAKKPTQKETHCLMMLAMAATYDPDPNSFLGIRLPVDLETCALIPERWAQWLEHDPVLIAASNVANLKRLKGLYIDCGSEDQFHLHYGSRRLHQTLNRLGVRHRYEEFPDDHSSVDYRMDVSLPFLVEALSQ